MNAFETTCVLFDLYVHSVVCILSDNQEIYSVYYSFKVNAFPNTYFLKSVLDFPVLCLCLALIPHWSPFYLIPISILFKNNWNKIGDVSLIHTRI